MGDKRQAEGLDEATLAVQRAQQDRNSDTQIMFKTHFKAASFNDTSDTG